MKKIISVFLALVMILSLNTTAFATTLSIDDDGNRDYVGYQLLKLTTSLKTGEHTGSCDGVNHSSGCYNYAYTVNEKYREILQEEVGSESAGNVEILDYLKGQTGDNDTGTMRQVADRLYRAIKADPTITPDADNLDGEDDNIAQGYWMIADVTDLDDDVDRANSLVMVNTKGQNNLLISPKTALPTVEKKVKDINDSKDNDIKDNDWQDSADHDMYDVVPFKLTGTLPENVKNYKKFEMAFHDTLSAGLTLDPDSIKVYMYATKGAAESEAGAVNVTANFVKTTTGMTDGCTFEVSCEDVLDIAGVDKDTVFVVYYEATLNENAVIGAAGNPNEVYLEFSNDPYGNSTGKTKEDKVVVFTYQVIVNKTDEDGNLLEGAGFKLYKKNSEGTYKLIGAEQGGKDSSKTKFTWVGLDDGDYKLEESTVPDGYNKMSDIEFTISATHNPELTSLSGGDFGTSEVSTGKIEEDIVNNTGIVLPETGARGTAMLIGISSALVAVAAIFMITRKKMSIYED